LQKLRQNDDGFWERFVAPKILELQEGKSRLEKMDGELSELRAQKLEP